MIFVFIIFFIVQTSHPFLMTKPLYTLIFVLSIKMTIIFAYFLHFSVIMINFIINIAIYIGVGWGYNIIGILNP